MSRGAHQTLTDTVPGCLGLSGTAGSAELCSPGRPADYRRGRNHERQPKFAGMIFSGMSGTAVADAQAPASR